MPRSGDSQEYIQIGPQIDCSEEYFSAPCPPTQLITASLQCRLYHLEQSGVSQFSMVDKPRGGTQDFFL